MGEKNVLEIGFANSWDAGYLEEFEEVSVSA
jgi:hypothetical protein